LRFFGWSFGPQKQAQTSFKKQPATQRLPKDEQNDGAIELSSSLTGFIAHGINLNEMPTEDEVQLITKYREVSTLPEIEKAIESIINEAFTYETDDYPVSIIMDHIEEISEKVKDTIREEFENILDMLNFKNDSYEIFRKWYVDGRLFFQKVINEDRPEDGIIELQYIDPRKIKKVRQEIPQRGNNKAKFIEGIEVNRKYVEYYLYNPSGIQPENPQGLRITPDMIAFIHSGVFDRTNKLILSHLHKSIRPLNLMNMIENALVIYRLARAPERRVFNVEVGKLPKAKAEEYLEGIRRNHRKKLIYDAQTGEIKDDTRYMTMLEDFWFPKRDGKGTTVDTLQGGQNLGQMEDVDYFRRKLISSLNVPASRFDSTTGFNLGKSSEITRDELAFSLFIARLRKRFSHLFEDILGSQLILKKVLTLEEWENVRGQLHFDYQQNNFFSEFKWQEVWASRLASFDAAQELVTAGYVSRQWIRETVLHITEDEWEELQKQIEAEKKEAAEQAKKEQDANGGPPGQDGDKPDGFGGGGDGDDEDKSSDDDKKPDDGKDDKKDGKVLAHLVQVKDSVEALGDVVIKMASKQKRLTEAQAKLTNDKEEMEVLKDSIQLLVNELNAKA
jgi:hypothetical protein